MSDSNRLLIAAAAIGLVLCSLIWGAIGLSVLAGYPERQYTQAQIDGDRERQQRGAPPTAGILEQEACTEAARNAPYDPEDHNQRDLCAQYIAASAGSQTAFFTFFQTIIGLIGLAFVLGTMWLNYVATNAATEQSKVAKRAFEEADSGVVYVEALTGVSFRESRFHPDKEIPEFAFSVRNIGTRTVIVHFARVEFIEISEDRPFDDPTQPVTFTKPNGLPSIIEPILLKPDTEEQVDAAIGRPLEGDDWRRWGLYILGRVTYATHLSVVRESGFCFRWDPSADDDGHISRVWSYDRRKPQRDN